MATTIRNARIFDGERVIDEHTVVIDGPHIAAIGAAAPSDGIEIDAGGATLLPGLIDAHAHATVDCLRDALSFGVTTELEMAGQWTAKNRDEVTNADDIADVRSAGFPLRAPGGHPEQLFAASAGPAVTFPSVSTPSEAAAFVTACAANGSD
jgi:imidazolonepropionase-like amidohydrolase